MGSADPHNEEHIALLAEVESFLVEKGFVVTSATYHDVMPEKDANIFMDNFTPTSLYIRGRADRIAIHPRLKTVFEWEAKTHKDSDKLSQAAEVLPLLHHVQKAQLGVKCLYVLRDNRPFNYLDVGFWIDQRPRIAVVLFPRYPRYTTQVHSVIQLHAMRLLGLGTGDMKSIPHKNGSGDPFVVIDKEDAERLPHWKKLIEEAMTEKSPWG